MRIPLTESFSTLAVTEGTLQNGSLYALIEVATDTTENSGITLKPGEIIQIKSDVTLYARAVRRGTNEVDAPCLVHEPFKGAAEGGDSSNSDRKPSTAYIAGQLATSPTLDSGLILRCTTAGTTAATALDCSSYSLGDTITDGTAVWTVEQYVVTQNNAIPTNIYIPGAFNKKETFTASGSYTAPVTGVYRITLQGGGGGGGSNGGSGHNLNGSSGGGGQGGFGYAYETLTAGTSYSYVVGAGGAGGTESGGDGSNGGNTSITVNGNSYVAYGGRLGTAGWHTGAPGIGGLGGTYTVNGVDVHRGDCGGNGGIASTRTDLLGGNGGGCGGGVSMPYAGTLKDGRFGGGGAGGNTIVTSYAGTEQPLGGAGGNGYIVFEYYDPTA